MMCTWFGVDSGPSQEIECQCCLWDELAPDVWGKVCVCAIQDGDEVCFKGLDCSFCWVPSVHACVDQLAVKIFGSDAGCECIGNFIVKSVEDSFDSCICEALAACITPLDQVVCSSALDGLSEDCI